MKNVRIYKYLSSHKAKLITWHPKVIRHTPLSPALGRQRQVDFHEFEASLVYTRSSRVARAVTQRNCVLKVTLSPAKKSYQAYNEAGKCNSYSG